MGAEEAASSRLAVEDAAFASSGGPLGPRRPLLLHPGVIDVVAAPEAENGD